ncbi:VWA domain-containing protein [Streptomyces sp. NPDC048171]|uniref:VWA domain-containing protein n=1 Tax=unclassified Streptomyces TaxID=2593676 RepID=UPI00136ABF99|nr:VWA domain-containing protein [Streptomyces sp. SID5789]MZE69360.1 VWA domain-containing protein [Streptomyces sp. SID5789]
MGILTLLRNAFGRSRKEQTAPAEGATQETAPPVTAPEPKLPSQPTAPPETPAQPESTQVPEPRSESTPDEHDLVKAAFTNVNVPKPSAEPTPAPEAETTPEPKPDPEPEPKAKAEPKPDPEPEPKAEAEPKPEPHAKPEPKPKAEAEAKPEPKVEAKPEPEAKAEPKEKAEAPQPAAADDEDAPQGPPAPDNESRTGGAGGNKDSEGEAEETTHPEPEAPAEETTHPEPQADATPKPATTPARLRSRAPALTTAYKAAATTLKTHDLTGTRAKVHLVLDRSASMRPYYKDGSAQALAEQTLALAAHLDPEATVHVTFFSTELDGTGDLTLTDHENKIDELHAALGRMGRTSYHAAVEAVLAHHEKEAPGTPALVVFQTDGAPDAKTPATQSLTDAAKNHPNVHFSFVAFGDPENKAFEYLRKLKTGNTSHFLAGETPKELTDEELYEGVLASWRP